MEGNLTTSDYCLAAIDGDWKSYFIEDIMDKYGLPFSYNPATGSIAVTGSPAQIRDLDEYYCEAVADCGIPGYAYELQVHGAEPAGIEQDPDFYYDLTHCK